MSITEVVPMMKALEAILEYFEPAVLANAAPKDANVDTYAYFGEPIYEYSLNKVLKMVT